MDSPSRVAEVDSGHDESLNSSLNSNLNTTVGSAGNQEVLRAVTNMQDDMASQFIKMNQNFKKYEETISNLQNELSAVHDKVKTQSSVTTKCVLPTDLSHLVRGAYKSLDDENKWMLGDARFDCHQNISVTRSVIQILKDQDENLLNSYAIGLVRRACRRYFESLRRQGREKDNEEDHKKVKKQRKIVARRHRLFKSRSKHVPEENKEVWANITAEFMSDEETDEEGTARRTLVWRSEDLVEFIHYLDEERNLPNVRYGPPSERGPSTRVDASFIKDKP